MKVKFVCDCCDAVFDETEVEDTEEWMKMQSLTDVERQDIILQDREEDNVFVSSTCRECSDELGMSGMDDLSFFRMPLIH